MLNSYMKKMFEVANRGDAREESYYSILEGLLARDVYPKLVRLYIKIGRLSEPISYANKLYEMAPMKNDMEVGR